MPVFSVIPRKDNLISGIINSVAEMSLIAGSNTQPRSVQAKSQV
jgi:hypothetical protein